MTQPINTQILTVDASHPQPESIAQAAHIITAGNLVAFPTETVYGLGANALDAAAIQRIYTAKQRPASDPIIAHIHTADQLDQLAREVPSIAYRLAEAFWPGALTLVLQRAPDVPENIAAGRATVAVRMPAHPVAAALIAAAGVPIAAPSANTFTRPSATTAVHVLEDLNGRVHLVLDAGHATIGVESTVLDLTAATPTILRPGGVTLDAVREIVPDVILSPRYVDSDPAGTTAETGSPGQMLKHYSPRAQVVLFSGETAKALATMQRYAETGHTSGKQVGVLAFDEEAAQFSGVTIESLGRADDLTQMGQRLFAAMRALDARGVDVILVRDPGREGLGAALWDRLLRAAEGQVTFV